MPAQSSMDVYIQDEWTSLMMQQDYYLFYWNAWEFIVHAYYNSDLKAWEYFTSKGTGHIMTPYPLPSEPLSPSPTECSGFWSMEIV